MPSCHPCASACSQSDLETLYVALCSSSAYLPRRCRYLPPALDAVVSPGILRLDPWFTTHVRQLEATV
eukprot:6012837-Pleurochrysis_carterae.AAC.1